MKKIAFLELSHVFTNQVKVPYSTGCVWSYCRLNPIIQEHYSFDVRDWHYILDENFDVDETFEKVKDHDIIGVSYFVWNTVVSDEICQKVKEYNPNAIIVYGGLGTPKWGLCDEFLKERPYVDFIVHNEGEIVFENLLVALATGGDLRDVKGITTREFCTELEARIKDIASMPSPYLDGLFDDLVAITDMPYKFEAMVEPERGCPYTCAFCEVGDRFFTKIMKQPLEKVCAEIDWVSKQEIDYMHIIDNNYGMFPHHDDLTDYVIHKRDTTGYPNALNITWAKNKKPFLFNIAKKMHEAKLNKGVTIALQSMNPATLKAVRRDNLDRTNLKAIVEKLRSMKVPAYIELILGLPEETFDSFKNGLYELMDEVNYHNFINIYIMVALPNTPFGDPKYRDEYGVVLKKTSPAFFHHEHPPEKLLKDTNDLVATTRTLPFEDYLRAMVWRWFMASTHMLGWTRVLAIELNTIYGLKFRDFYDNLFEYCMNNNTVLKGEHDITDNLVRRVFDREIPWGRKLEDVSGIYWEYEEATAITIAQNKDLFYKEVKDYISKYYGYFDDPITINNLIDKQYHKMKDPYELYDGDLEKWCTECMWWGRRIERFFVGENL